jgi:inhibitor of KinA sporulation pathway (predicted exonuclease)
MEEVSVSRSNLQKVAAKYAMRRAGKPKKSYDDSTAQEELLRVMEDSSQSLRRANMILDV